MANERDQRMCNNWRNLRPMWGKDNFLKHDKLPLDFKQRWKELEAVV